MAALRNLTLYDFQAVAILKAVEEKRYHYFVSIEDSTENVLHAQS
jgi:hypothetical protein